MRIIDGWISLHRKLLDSAVFQNADLLKVWIWCLLKATHEDYELLVGLQLVKLKPGQFVTGRFKGAEELQLNPSTFYKYIKSLEKLEMICVNSNNKMTLITVENWAKYQTEEGRAYQQKNNKVTTKEQQSNTNNNSNNINNSNNMGGTPTPPKEPKHKYGEFKQVLLSDSEVESLKEKLGEQVMKEYIRRLDEYIGSKGASYKSHYLTILKWHRDDGAKVKPQKDTKKDFNEREYDYDDLERKLLGRGQ